MRSKAWRALIHDRPVRGIATSGWGGRSFSLGIADAVTVLAQTPPRPMPPRRSSPMPSTSTITAIERHPARELDPDSDLGDLPVTTAVGALPQEAIERALDRGAAEARRLQRLGLIEAAALSLKGTWRIEGTGALARQAEAG